MKKLRKPKYSSLTNGSLYVDELSGSAWCYGVGMGDYLIAPGCSPQEPIPPSFH